MAEIVAPAVDSAGRAVSLDLGRVGRVIQGIAMGFDWSRPGVYRAVTERVAWLEQDGDVIAFRGEEAERVLRLLESWEVARGRAG